MSNILLLVLKNPSIIKKAYKLYSYYSKSGYRLSKNFKYFSASSTSLELYIQHKENCGFKRLVVNI